MHVLYDSFTTYISFLCIISNIPHFLPLHNNDNTDNDINENDNVDDGNQDQNHDTKATISRSRLQPNIIRPWPCTRDLCSIIVSAYIFLL